MFCFIDYKLNMVIFDVHVSVYQKNTNRQILVTISLQSQLAESRDIEPVVLDTLASQVKDFQHPQHNRWCIYHWLQRDASSDMDYRRRVNELQSSNLGVVFQSCHLKTILNLHWIMFVFCMVVAGTWPSSVQVLMVVMCNDQ